MSPTVVIDPGHGGSSALGGSSANNATGPNGLVEKELTLDLARRVSALLAGRATVILTRTTDSNLSLADRAKVARDNNADVFVSIHLNGWSDPAVDGSEAWVATHAAGSSSLLARSVLDQILAVTHARDRGVKKQDFGVLLPQRLAANTAATLIETAFLTNPSEAGKLAQDAYKQALAQAIATGISSQLPTSSAPTQLPSDGGVAQSLATTDQADAIAIVNAFRAETTAGAFTPRRDDVADRAIALVGDPSLVDQASLNLCGPAAVHRLWIERDPKAFARYLTTLYDNGSASFGSLTVSAGSDLRNQDYDGTAVPAMRTAGGVCPAAEWVAMSALRDSTNSVLDFEGMPSEDVSAMSTPAEVAGWLRATGKYDVVRDEGNWMITKDVAHAEGLFPGANTDVVLLINAHILTSSAASGHKKSDEFILGAFPNHFVVLRSAVTEPTPDEVEFDCWTWGSDVHVRLRKDVFTPNYYGAVIATVTVPATASALGTLGDPITTADSALATNVIPAASCGVLNNGAAYTTRVPTSVVIHVLDDDAGADADIASWHAGQSCTPPHYVIRDDGVITQLVAERFMAQHAGPGGNPTMIGIEHDGRDNDPMNFTEEMYLSSAALVRDICARNAIPVDRAHIIGHDEVPGTTHGDPGGYWDWDYYMALVRWDGADQAAKPLRDVLTTDNLSLEDASVEWHQLDRDSGNAAWRTDRHDKGPFPRNSYGPNFLWAQASPTADATDAITYTYTVPQAGTWSVSAWWPILGDANTRARIEVSTTRSTDTQPDTALDYDQTDMGPMRTRATLALPHTPTWRLLGGSYDLQRGDVITVRVRRRSDAAGRVLADSIRFLKT